MNRDEMMDWFSTNLDFSEFEVSIAIVNTNHKYEYRTIFTRTTFYEDQTYCHCLTH